MLQTSPMAYLGPSNANTFSGARGSADASAIERLASAAADAGVRLPATSSQALSPVAIPLITERPKLASASIRRATLAAPPSLISDSTSSALPLGVHAESLQALAVTRRQAPIISRAVSRTVWRGFNIFPILVDEAKNLPSPAWDTQMVPTGPKVAGRGLRFTTTKKRISAPPLNE